jgi:hypothetical protein
MPIRTISALAAALATLLFVIVMPTGAAAHAGHVHAAPAKHASGAVAVDKTANTVPVELRTHIPASADHPADTVCSDRGCCSNGHCSGYGGVLAPAAWAGFGPLAAMHLMDCGTSLPSALAREGPARPPRPFA